MTVALLVGRAGEYDRLVPVSTEATFEDSWLPGIVELGLHEIALMQTGIDVDAGNREAVIADLAALRTWMTEHTIHPYISTTLDTLVEELTALRFEYGAIAFLGLCDEPNVAYEVVSTRCRHENKAMTVALMLGTAGEYDRLVPVAPEAIFLAMWQPGIDALGLQRIELMGTGIDIDAENRDAVISDLGALKAWMTARQTHPYEITRLDTLVEELTALRFDDGAIAFLG